MKKFLLYLLIIIGAAIHSACVRKELPEPVVTSPDFSVSGLMNGTSFEMVAGQQGYFADGTVEQDPFGVYHFTSEIRKYNCTGCPGRLTIKLTSLEAYQQGEIPPAGEAIQPDEYAFQLTPSDTSHLAFQFFAPPGPNNTYYWSFGDGAHSIEQNPQHTYAAEGIREVTLSVIGFGGCAGNSSQTIYAGSNYICSFPPFIEDGENNSLHISIPEQLPDGLGFTGWTVDNNPGFPVENELEIDFGWGISHTICAHYFNSILGVSGSYCILLFGPGQQPCTSIMHAQPATQIPGPGTVVIEYQTEEGTVYSSAFPDNNLPASSFEVTEINNYTSVLNGHSTVRGSIRFTATLVNTEDEESTITLENITGDMLFVLP